MSLIEKYNTSNLFGKENNLQLTVIDKGHIQYTMQVEEKHMATPNVMHGGAIAGMMDALLSVAAFSAVADDNKHVATIEFKINYLRAVRKACMLKGIGKVIRLGSKIAFTEAEIRDEDNHLIATASGSIMILDGD